MLNVCGMPILPVVFAGGDEGGADPDQEVGGLVGAPAGRAAGDLRGAVPAHRNRPEVPPGGGTPPAPQPGPRRAVRFPDVVRVRARRRGWVRRTGRRAAGD